MLVDEQEMVSFKGTCIRKRIDLFPVSSRVTHQLMDGIHSLCANFNLQIENIEDLCLGWGGSTLEQQIERVHLLSMGKVDYLDPSVGCFLVVDGSQVGWPHQDLILDLDDEGQNMVHREDWGPLKDVTVLLVIWWDSGPRWFFLIRQPREIRCQQWTNWKVSLDSDYGTWTWLVAMDEAWLVLMLFFRIDQLVGFVFWACWLSLVVACVWFRGLVFVAPRLFIKCRGLSLLFKKRECRDSP